MENPPPPVPPPPPPFRLDSPGRGIGPSLPVWKESSESVSGVTRPGANTDRERVTKRSGHTLPQAGDTRGEREEEEELRKE